MTEKHSLQTIILELQNFWAARGCTIAQPYYTQVGAGTMNPATFLRVLGPEPWNVSYVELPSAPSMATMVRIRIAPSNIPIFRSS